MHIFSYTFVSNRSLSIFNVVIPLNTLQKKVAFIALAAFSCIVTCCLLYRIFFKWNVQQLKFSTKKKEIISDAKEHEDIENQANLSSLSLSKIVPKEGDLPQEIETKFKTYLSLLRDSNNLYNYADITIQNALSLKDARVVLIGDTHTMPSHISITKFIIEFFGRENDIHLVEGTEGKYKRLFKHMDTYGWDNMEMSKQSQRVVKQALDLNKQQLQIKHFSDEQNLSQEEINKKVLILFNHLLFFGRKRTESLIQCLHDFLLKFPDKKIFVTAGKGHLIEGKTFNILNHLPPEEKCALVMLKNLDPVNEGDDLKYAESFVDDLE